MAEEFASALQPSELGMLMARIGKRFARQYPLSECSSLDEVVKAANRVWLDSDWGCCSMSESQDAVLIQHVGSPLHLAVGADWTDCFLQGVYEGWFRQQGMPAGLVVVTAAPVSADQRVFRLVREA